MNSCNKDKEKVNKKNVGIYLKENLKNADLYVPNIANCSNKDVEYIFLTESPHKDELEKKYPLAGSSGKAISKFLFGNDATKPFGELVNNRDPQIENAKIAIVNVSNIPLQIIDDKNDGLVDHASLNKFRNECEINKQLESNLEKGLIKYPKAKTIIVCGGFAKTYFDQVSNKISNKNLKLLYVPHPSHYNWQFVFKHKDDIGVLKWLFSNKKEGE